MNLSRLALLVILSLSGSLRAQLPLPDGGGIQAGTLPLTWSTGGPKCMEMPEWQVHEYNPQMFILRQSGCTDYEKPFVYLIFGKTRALLFDTGSRNGNLAPTLMRVMHLYLKRNNLASLPLVVTHSHSHGDHTAGDKEIQALNDAAVPITFVGATVEATKALYKIANWPTDVGSIDLGERVLDVIPIPGHDAVSVALYDRQTAVLLTGDSVYPGRLYIRDLDAFTKSNQRLIDFTVGKPVAHILGCHVEQTRTPFLDYPTGTMYQPEEHALALSRAVLLEMQQGLDAMHGTPKRVAFADLTLWPNTPGQRQAQQGPNSFREVQKYQQDHMWDFTKP